MNIFLSDIDTYEAKSQPVEPACQHARAVGNAMLPPVHVAHHTVFIMSFCKRQFPHKSVNLFFISVIRKDKLTDLCGN